MASRDHSLYELESKLSRHFEAEIIQAALREAKRRGWLADENELARRLAVSLRRRNKSHAYIRAQLKKRRLPLVEWDSDEETATAVIVLRKKFRNAPSQGREMRARAIRFLKNRGFGDAAIQSAVKEWQQPQTENAL